MSYQNTFIPIGTVATSNYTSAWHEVQRALMANGALNIRIKTAGLNSADATLTLWESNDGGTTEYQNTNVDLTFATSGEEKMEVMPATGTHYRLKFVKNTNSAGTIQAIANLS